MIALYIIAAVIGIFALLFFCRIYITFSYGGGDELSLSVRYTFWRMRLVPSAGGKIRLGNYTYKKTHKKDKKKKKKTKDSQEKSAAKPRKGKKTASKKKSAEKEPPVEGEKKQSAVAMLFELREIIFDLLIRAPRKLRLEIKRLRLTVGASDAAKTAITYGVVTQAVGAALTLAEEHADVRIKDDAVMIAYDFLSGKIDADVHLRLSVRVGSILGLGLRFIFNFLKLKLLQNKN